MKKLIFKNSLIWMFPLAIYIFEIVLVCVTGPSLVNNICAWVSCIAMFLMVAIPSIISLSKSQYKLKQLENEIEEHWKNYNDLSFLQCACKFTEKNSNDFSSVAIF